MAMRDERFDPEELAKVRVEAARCGSEEREVERLVALGRRAEALLEAKVAPLALEERLANDDERLGAFTAWDFFRSTLKGDSNG